MFGLLLSWMWLFSMTVHDLVVECGQRPSCGGGASSLLSEFGTMPARFLSHSEFLSTRWPPAFVPENPSAPFSEWAWLIVALQSGHAPT